jgi:hypothetical protein
MATVTEKPASVNRRALRYRLNCLACAAIPTGPADTKEHPPTDTMNRMAGDKAMSSQDAQRQQQGEPTAAQQARAPKPSANMADQGR